MKNSHLVLLVLIVTMFIAPSCNKPSVIGGELLEQDQVNVAFTDSITIVAKTILSDSIKTYDLDNQLDYFLCGDLNDPIFGGVKATNYVQTRLSIFNPVFKNEDRVDSVVLSIVYDTIAMYGNVAEEHTINVHRLSEDLDNSEIYYSNDAFMFDPMPLGTKTFTPNLYGLAPSISYYNDEPRFDTLSPSLRIPLDIAFGEEIFDLEEMDSTIFANDTLFLDNFKGFYIETEGENKESMLSFSYRNIGSRLQVYYTRDDTLNKQYDFILSNASVKQVNFDHYGASASDVNDFVENTTLGDSLLFLQGMQGVNVSFRFPYIEDLNGLIINKATLELTVATIEGDDIEIFEPGDQFLLSEKTEDGELLLIEDVVRAFNVSNINVFGGGLETDEDLNLKTYKLNLSAAMQDMVQGEVSDEVILTLFLSTQRANRSVIFGPGHSTYPAKLKVTYTDN